MNPHPLPEAPFSEGPLDSPLALVGQAPGPDEMRERRPFIGKSGQRLNEILRVLGIHRPMLRIENLFQFELPRSTKGGYNPAQFVRPLSNSRAPHSPMHLSPEVVSARSALIHRLSASSARVIVTFGNEALWALTDRWGITDWRGSILSSPDLPGRAIVPAIHPATRSWPTDTHLIQMDLRRAYDLCRLANPLAVVPRRDLEIRPSFENVKHFVDLCRRPNPDGICRIAVDIELMRDHISCISLATSPTCAICIPFAARNEPWWSPTREREVWSLLSDLLCDPTVEKIFHNAIFDTYYLFRDYGIRPFPCHDTMILQGIAMPDFPKSLAFCASLWTCQPYWKYLGDSKLWEDFDSFSGPTDDGHGTSGEDRFWTYNALDSAVDYEIFLPLIDRIAHDRNLEAYERQRSLVEPLLHSTVVGLHADLPQIRTLGQEALLQAQKIARSLEDLTGVDFIAKKGVSNARVAKYFYTPKSEGGCGISPFTKDGSITTSGDVMTRIYRNDKLPSHVRQAAHDIRALRRVLKAKGTYYDLICDPDGRLRCSWNLVGTPGGRLSSSKTIRGTGLNLQNPSDEIFDEDQVSLTPGVQRCIQATPGSMFVSIDYSMAELRVMAYFAHEQRMISAFESGADLHLQTATLVLEAMRRPVPDPMPKKVRTDKGKRPNFGLGYGQSADQFSLTADLPLHEARATRDAWFKVYPAISRWHREVDDRIRTTRTLTNALGRSRRFTGKLETKLYRRGYNFLCQSTVADMLNQFGLVPAYRLCGTPPGMPFQVLNQVHDSVVLEFRGTAAAQFERHASILCELVRTMETPIRINAYEFVVPADISVGFNLHDMHELPSEVRHDPAALTSCLYHVLGEEAPSTIQP